jgi:hypothetical protein
MYVPGGKKVVGLGVVPKSTGTSLPCCGQHSTAQLGSLTPHAPPSTPAFFDAHPQEREGRAGTIGAAGWCVCVCVCVCVAGLGPS